MRVGVSGIVCELCPRRRMGSCPSGEEGCTPKADAFCPVSACAARRGERWCLECAEFPCDTFRESAPFVYEYCLFLAGKRD